MMSVQVIPSAVVQHVTF